MSTNPSAVRANRRPLSGYRKALVREAQSLPLHWRHLTEVDVDQVKRLVDEIANDPDASLRQLEAVLLLWATLTTGRDAQHLLGLRMQALGAIRESTTEGLYKVGRDWGWWLTAGTPASQNAPSVEIAASLEPWSPLLYLPATDLVTILVERCMDLRLDDGGSIVADRSVALFSLRTEMLGDVTRLLTNRNPIGIGRTRAATTTPEALARWLPAALIQMAGGDVVHAAVITGRVDRVGRTPVYYGAVSQREINAQYSAAMADVDRPSHDATPDCLVAKVVGDRLTPTDAAVRSLIDRLGSRLSGPRGTIAQQHAAMTNYTVALLAFALAHRGDVGAFPSLFGIDADTRFCWIEDKVAAEGAVRRLVWVCDTAMEQLRRYENHLDRLEGSLGATIKDVRDGCVLPLFRLTQGGETETLTVSAAVREAVRDAGTMPKNAGRHWLRARLRGRCSSETLHALCGHGLVDEGSWGWTMGLDPAVYRADLARTLDPLLAGIGWVPRGALPLKKRA